MTSDVTVTDTSLVDVLRQQNELQRQLIDAQQEIIRLHQKIERMTPPLPDEDVIWHRISGGITSEEALNSGDLEKVQALNQWIHAFGEKYIKPYIHLKAYGEMMAHMMRGVSRRLAELEVLAEFELPLAEAKTLDFSTLAEKMQNRPEAVQRNTNDEPAEDAKPANE